MIMTASKILNILSTKPLDDHSRFIKDLLTDLLRLCPISLAEYLDQRLIKVPWTPLFTDGKLKQENMSDFAVHPLNLFPLTEEIMKKAIFDDSEDYVDVKMPLKLVVADLPDIH
jgi:hypothetical protein